MEKTNTGDNAEPSPYVDIDPFVTQASEVADSISSVLVSPEVRIASLSGNAV